MLSASIRQTGRRYSRLLDHLDRRGSAQDARERAAVELGGELDGAGGLRLGHSDRGRAEGASGKARMSGSQRLTVGRGQRG